MQRKGNPLVSLVALVLLAIILVSVLTACSGSAAAATETTTRFTVELQESNIMAVWIITDTETGQQYLFVKSGYGGGLTKLEG